MTASDVLFSPVKEPEMFCVQWYANGKKQQIMVGQVSGFPGRVRSYKLKLDFMQPD